MWKPVDQIIARWKPDKGAGLEHLVLQAQAGGGGHLNELDGCIDVDFTFTCFTNTLPVRRTSFDKGQARTFQMLYVYFDRLVPVADGQRYTCLEPGRRFLFEATDGGFTREIEFDDYGLVQNYPGLYHRVD